MAGEAIKVAAAQTNIAETQAKTAKAMAAMAEAQAAHAADHNDTKEKLNLLMKMVDEWIREHRAGNNGEAKGDAPKP